MHPKTKPFMNNSSSQSKAESHRDSGTSGAMVTLAMLSNNGKPGGDKSTFLRPGQDCQERRIIDKVAKARQNNEWKRKDNDTA